MAALHPYPGHEPELQPGQAITHYATVPDPNNGDISLGSKIKDEIKEKSKNIIQFLDRGHAENETHPELIEPYQGTKSHLDKDIAFNPDLLAKEKEPILDARTRGGKIKEIATTVVKAVKNPRSIAKKTAASTFALGDKPHLSEKSDSDYLHALNEHGEAKLQSEDPAFQNAGDFSRLANANERVEILEDDRTAKKVAWVTSRYIDRVAVVVNEVPEPPNRADFCQTGANTGKVTFDWQAYAFASMRYQAKKMAIQNIGEIDAQPCEPFDKDVCLKYMERILIASSPWQNWFCSMRSIYRWDNPKETAKWAIIWSLVWSVNYMSTFVIGWIIYIVLNNRFRNSEAQHMRDSDARVRDAKANVFRFNELISRYGKSDWVEPLMEEVGPTLQMQMCDVADSLEILYSFYNWRNPYLTWCNLSVFIVVFALGIFNSPANNIKLFWMSGLMAFFGCRPIASHHQQYRHTVQGFRWMFWHIPTEAEWCMEYLRTKAQKMRNTLVHDKVDEQVLPGTEMDGVNIMTDSLSIYTIASNSSGNSPVISESVPTLGSEKPFVSFSTIYKSHNCTIQLLPSTINILRISSIPSRQHSLITIQYEKIREIRKFSTSPYDKLNPLAKKNGIRIIYAEELPPQPPTVPLQSSSTANTLIKGEDVLLEHKTVNGVGIVRPLTLPKTKMTTRRSKTKYIFKTIRLLGLESRDELFNCLVGFSGLKFQVLPGVKESKLSHGNTSSSDNDSDEEEDKGNGSESRKRKSHEMGMHLSNGTFDLNRQDQTLSSESDDENEYAEKGKREMLRDKVRKVKRKIGFHDHDDDGEGSAERKIFVDQAGGVVMENTNASNHKRGLYVGNVKRGTHDGAQGYDSYQAFRKGGFWDGWFA